MKGNKTFIVVIVIILLCVILFIVFKSKEKRKGILIKKVLDELTFKYNQLCPTEINFSCEQNLNCEGNIVTFSAYVAGKGNIFPNENRFRL
jgi:hypothetical protein